MKSYLKFLSRNKLYTVIEFLGLAVSLAFVILIGSYVVQQYQVSHESRDWKRTFVLGSDEALALTYWDKDELEMNLPEVEVATHVAMLWQPVAQIDEEVIKISGLEADADFFSLFPQYRIVDGSARDFVGSTDVLISQSFARRVAKDKASLVGSTLKVNDTDLTIKGVFADFDRTYFMPFDIITNISNSWGASRTHYKFNNIGGYSTWYRVRQDADLEDVGAKVKALLHKNYNDHWKAEVVEKWHPYRMDEAFFFSGNNNGITHTGNLQMLKLLTIVVLLLLLSAIFNYVNLNLALTGKRSKEMAIRQLVGADSRGILWKYIFESVAFTAVCFAGALMLAYLLAPMMNGLVSVSDPQMASVGIGDTNVNLSFMITPGYLLAYIIITLLLGIINGILPALAASRFEPIDVIKGTSRRHSKMTLSRVFIVGQNVLAVFLIAMALVMEVQMRHMLTRPTHSAVDNLYYIEYNTSDYDKSKLFMDKVEALPFVTQVGMGRGLPGHVFTNMSVPADETHQVSMAIIICDTTYFKLLGMEIKEDFGHPLPRSIWMSESAFNTAGVSDTSAVFARRIVFNSSRSGSRSRTRMESIGGIVHDFPTGSASQGENNPNGAIIVTNVEELPFANCLLISTIGEDKSYDKAIRNAYREYLLEQSGVEEPAWNYGFIRDLNHKQLEPERRTLRLVELFTFLAVMIALLGLLAMSTYFADENTKQIAVRKVFGADVSSETWRNVKSYMILTGIACVIGIPLAIWAARIYLRRFAYHIEGYGWVFAVAVIISLAIAFGTVLWQTLKAARTNPAEELKKE